MGGGGPLSRPLDEDDVRVRAGGPNRPRTRRRPSHDDAAAGVVVAVDRGRSTVRVGGVDVVAMKARELGRRALAVGDRVALVGDLTGGDDALARIVRVEPRQTVLRRTPDDDDPVERVLVANAERLLIVASLADPPPQPGLIDRCLVAAYDGGVEPVLCLTKSDLAPADPAVDAYAELALPVLVLGRAAGALVGLDRVRAELRDRVTALVGSSGVGKSTLVNALVPAADRAVGGVNPVTGRGRHTSSSAVALALPEGGWVIDTPGVRSFGLGRVDAARVRARLPESAGVRRDALLRLLDSREDPLAQRNRT